MYDWTAIQMEVWHSEFGMAWYLSKHTTLHSKCWLWSCGNGYSTAYAMVLQMVLSMVGHRNMV